MKCEATVYFEDDESLKLYLTMWTKFFLGKISLSWKIYLPEKIIKHGSKSFIWWIIRSL